MNQTNQRFTVIGATSLLDLVGALNKLMPPFAHLVYFGPNFGDYSDRSRYNDDARNSTCMAIFDNAPVFVLPVDDVELVDVLTENDTLPEVTTEMKTTMSA